MSVKPLAGSTFRSINDCNTNWRRGPCAETKVLTSTGALPVPTVASVEFAMEAIVYQQRVNKFNQPGRRQFLFQRGGILLVDLRHVPLAEIVGSLCVHVGDVNTIALCGAL